MNRVPVQFLLLVAAVVGLSFVSSRLWGGKPEGPVEARSLVLETEMTVAQFGQRNELPPKLLKKVFGLQRPEDRQKLVATFGMSRDQVLRKAQRLLALQAEHASKNWVKILLKFVLWFGLLATVFAMMVRGRVTARTRRLLYLAAVAVFGVILGSDPSPMGTVKDAVVLFGSQRVIFPPRLIAFGVFLLLVVVANKFICAWGCQFGTLQDLIFRLNRDKKDRQSRGRQFKVPFAVANGIRIAFFVALTATAFVWATDIVEGIDPFKIFKPQVMGLLGIAFGVVLLIASLFIYRPWCHCFCPFGLAGWVAEKISLFKIKVDYSKCIRCDACSKACPSTVMEAILKQDRTVPDCFACGVCIEACPVDAIAFKCGKRAKPPLEPVV